MIRKNVCCLCAVISIMLLSKLYSNTKVDSFGNPYEKMILEHAKRMKQEKGLDYFAEKKQGSLSFAEVEVPIERTAVNNKVNKYLTAFSYNKIQSYQMHKRASEFLPRIAEILSSYGVPDDFKYIPIVESGLDPRVLSHKGAGGYWQFMPATARLYGLRVDSEVDERLDFEKSSHAAAKYLKSLYEEFGDWTLVAAAYNLGGGRLKNTIKRQGLDDYYSLRLNSETGSYIYKLVSVKQVIEYPSKYGYKRAS